MKILIWDHNRDRLVERASVVYADPAAARYVWGAGFHWYGEDHFEQLQLVRDAWPDKCCSPKAARKAARTSARGRWPSVMRAR